MPIFLRLEIQKNITFFLKQTNKQTPLLFSSSKVWACFAFPDILGFLVLFLSYLSHFSIMWLLTMAWLSPFLSSICLLSEAGGLIWWSPFSNSSTMRQRPLREDPDFPRNNIRPCVKKAKSNQTHTPPPTFVLVTWTPVCVSALNKLGSSVVEFYFHTRPTSKNTKYLFYSRKPSEEKKAL